MELRERLQEAQELVARNKGKIGVGGAALLIASAAYALNKADSEPEPDPSHIGESIGVDEGSIDGRVFGRVVVPASRHSRLPNGDPEDGYSQHLLGLAKHQPRPNGDMDADWTKVPSAYGFDYRDGERFGYSGEPPRL